VNSGTEVTEDPTPVGALPLKPDATVDARLEF
jgi:hypothetical protein